MKDKDKTKDELLKELHDLRQENNSIKKLYEADMDILRQAEKTLAQERYLLDAIMNNLPDHIYFKDRESRFIRITKDHAQSFGLSDPLQAIGKTDFDFFTEEHARQAYEDEQTVIQTGQPFSKEEKLTWPDRPDTWSSTTKLPLRDKEGNIIGTFGISRDITKSKLAEEALQESEEHYSLLFNEALDGVCLADAETGLIIDCNKALLSLVGRQRAELIGQSQKILHPPRNSDTTFSPEFEQHLTDKEGKTLETNIITSTGIIRDVEIKANYINLHGRKTLQGVFRDITERKQAEEALAQERYLMNALMDNLPDHIYFKDRESRIIRINMSMTKFLGLNDPAQAVGKTDFDFFTGEHAQQAYEDEQTIIKTGQLLRMEEKETHSDRPDTWVSTIKMPMRDKEGDIIGTFGISRDVTEHRKAHEELEKEHNLLLALINNMPDRIYAKDTQSRFIICNNALVKRMGKSGSDDIIGKTDFDLVPHDLAAQYYANEQEIIRSGLPLIDHEESMGNISGTLRWNLSTKVPFRDSKGNIIGIVGMGRDNTDRKRKEQEAQVLFDINQGITTSNNLDELLILIHQSLGKVVYAENCFIALYNQKTGLFSFPYFVDKVDQAPQPTSMGKSCSAYVFRTVKPLLLTQKIFDQLLEQNEVELIGSNSPSWIGIPLQTPSSTIGVLVLQHYEKENVYSESDVKFLISVGTQIAISIERKKAEEEIKIKNELLQAINAEKDKFFSIIAHDLRGPLSAFVAATQIITEDIQNMTLDEIRHITMSMKTDASNIYKLLENLLEWSRLQRGVMEFNPQKFILRNIISTGIGAVSGSAKTKDIEMNINIPGDIEVTADIHMFETVVRNLVSNAVKFTPGGGKVTVTATITSENLVEIRITDTGIGMTPELKAKLFSMTEKTNRPGTAGEPSSGLGLLLCKEFIEKHGGKIWVDSEEGKGSTFVFTIGPSDNLTI